MSATDAIRDVLPRLEAAVDLGGHVLRGEVNGEDADETLRALLGHLRKAKRRLELELAAP